LPWEWTAEIALQRRIFLQGGLATLTALGVRAKPFLPIEKILFQTRKSAFFCSQECGINNTDRRNLPTQVASSALHLAAGRSQSGGALHWHSVTAISMR
jgi:hypothetical protein